MGHPSREQGFVFLLHFGGTNKSTKLAARFS